MQPEQNTNNNSTTNIPAFKKFSMPNVEFANIKQKLNLKTLLLVFLIVIVGLLGYLSKKYVLAATVNGKPITRLEVLKESERRSGKDVVENLINTELVKQEALSRKIFVTDDEINAKISEIDTALKSRGQSLEVALKDQKLTQPQFRDIIETNLLLEKMIAGTIDVTDKEVDEYIEANKSVLPTDVNPDELKKQVKESIKDQKLNTESQTFITNLRTKANVVFMTQY